MLEKSKHQKCPSLVPHIPVVSSQPPQQRSRHAYEQVPSVRKERHIVVSSQEEASTTTANSNNTGNTKGTNRTNSINGTPNQQHSQRQQYQRSPASPEKSNSVELIPIIPVSSSVSGDTMMGTNASSNTSSDTHGTANTHHCRRWHRGGNSPYVSNECNCS
jgi:hypothetical protein